MNTDVIVVGGGIAGTTVAWELARRGTRVTLFEQRTLAAGTSGRNTGTLLHQVEPPVAAMLRETEARYRELEAGDVDFRWTPREELLLARDPEQLRVVEHKAAVFAGQGVPAALVSGDDVRAELPALAEDVLGGAVLGGAWTVAAEAATRAFAEAARAAGAQIRTGTRVGEVRVAGSRVHGVLTDDGPVAADAVIVATGPWLTELLPLAPMKPGRGWLMRSQRLDFDVPWIIEEVSWPDQDVLGAAGRPIPLADMAAGRLDQPVADSFVLCPLPDGDAFVGASLSTSLRDAVEGIDAPQRIAARALACAPGLAQSVAITRAWWGLRPMTPDGLPLAGAAGVEGLFIHGGHASLGMQAAPATAAWLAAALHGEPVPPTFDDLRPDRFTGSPT
ncbi:MAG TPA: FAD-dependent oxidoreductase [Solirubrobacter sp.]|nr:FAD-dependent oxidoreductase [Solirubrobacter sp.]